MSPPCPGCHCSRKYLTGEDRAHQVEVEHPTQGIRRKIKEGLFRVGGCLQTVCLLFHNQISTCLKFDAPLRLLPQYYSFRSTLQTIQRILRPPT